MVPAVVLQVVPLSTHMSISLLANVHLRVALSVPGEAKEKSATTPVPLALIPEAPVVTMVVTGAATGVGAGAEGAAGDELPPQPAFTRSPPIATRSPSFRLIIKPHILNMSALAAPG